MSKARSGNRCLWSRVSEYNSSRATVRRGNKAKRMGREERKRAGCNDRGVDTTVIFKSAGGPRPAIRAVEQRNGV